MVLYQNSKDHIIYLQFKFGIFLHNFTKYITILSGHINVVDVFVYPFSFLFTIFHFCLPFLFLFMSQLLPYLFWCLCLLMFILIVSFFLFPYVYFCVYVYFFNNLFFVVIAHCNFHYYDDESPFLYNYLGHHSYWLFVPLEKAFCELIHKKLWKSILILENIQIKPFS